MKDFLEFNFKNCCLWKKLAPALRIITKTLTGLFPLTWQDGIGGDLVDYSITGANSANLWDEEWEVGAFDVNTGVNIPNTDRIRSKNYIPVLPNTEYYFLSPFDIEVVFFGANHEVVKNAGWTRNQERSSSSNSYYVRFYTSGSYGNIYNHDISINYPSTDHDYHPHGVGDYGGKRNQLVQNGNFADTSDFWDSDDNKSIEKAISDGVLNVRKIAYNSSYLYPSTQPTIVQGNKYFAKFDYKINGSTVDMVSFIAGNTLEKNDFSITNEWENFERIFTGGSILNRLRAFSLFGWIDVGMEYHLRNVYMVDLTAMFGAGNEPSTVAEAKSRIAEVMGYTADYYPYDAGTDYYKIPVKVVDNADYEQKHTIYRTTQLTAGQTIRKTTDGLPNFTSLPTGYLQMGVDTAVAPSEGSVTYKSRTIGV